MHSKSVVKILDTGQNRFQLCHTAFNALRKQLNDNSRAREEDNRAREDHLRAQEDPSRGRDTGNALQRLSGVEQRDNSVDLGSANNAAGQLAEQSAVDELTAQPAAVLELAPADTAVGMSPVDEL